MLYSRIDQLCCNTSCVPKPCCAVLQTKGSITYNGHTFDEFIPERTSSYIDQQDIHLAELTVRETFDFAARCQGTGHKAGRLPTVLPLLLHFDNYMLQQQDSA